LAQLSVATVLFLVAGGCAKYNTYYNAKRAFDNAELIREERIKNGDDVIEVTGAQKKDYELAIQKAQKVLDEYPGHSLTDDSLFLQAKSYHRLNSYRMSIRKIDLLFTNFPATPYLEEAIYIQALNYLLVGNVITSQEYLDRLAKSYPDSRFQAEALKVSGENSFALEEWEIARTSFEIYLAEHPDAEGRDEIAMKLAKTYWELEDYTNAEPILTDLERDADSPELAFRARLLLARVLVRLGEFDRVNQVTGQLRSEAETFRADGEVTLVESEALIAQGRDDQAAVLLENLPDEWYTKDLKPRVNEVLGDIYMRRGEWEQARGAYDLAMRGVAVLENPDRTRAQYNMLKDYLAAEQSLATASPEKVASLKMLQANAMLFGFSRPWRAADLYLEVAADADAAADSLVGARALYGAALVYQEYLDNPDSADLLVAELQERYPDSPQAYVMSVGNQADLLTHLLEQDDLARAASGVGIGQVAVAGTGAGLPARLQTSSGLRRRMFYYQRKPNLILAPPPGAVPFEPALDLFEVEEQTESVLAPAQTEAAPADTMGVGLLSGAVSDTTDTAAGLVDTAQAAFAGTAYDTVQTTEPAVQAEALPDSTQAETPATSPDTPESAPPDSLGPGGEQ
jgi:predicted negative regulator of RcsB-dependent stress response